MLLQPWRSHRSKSILQHAIIALLWLLTVGLPHPAPGANPIDLAAVPAHTQYYLQATISINGTYGYCYYGGLLGTLLLDLDGDGHKEIICNTEVGIKALRQEKYSNSELWWHLLPTGYDPQKGLFAPGDLNRDGTPEIGILCRNQTDSSWLLVIFDPAAQVEIKHFTLPAGPDRRADGKWDGAYIFLGIAQVPAPGEPRAAIILLADTAFDLEPRGVVAIDIETGDQLWKFSMGPRPNPKASGLYDLNGDLVPEILVVGRAVNNLHGRTLNGTSDDTCWVFALDLTGQPLWSHPIFKGKGSSFAVVYPMPYRIGTGILLGTYNNVGNNSLTGLDGSDGTVLFEVSMPGRFTGLIPEDPNQPSFLAGNENRLYRILVGEGTPDIVPLARSQWQLKPLLVENLTPEPGREILALEWGHSLLLLDQECRILASAPSESAVNQEIQGAEICSVLSESPRIICFQPPPRNALQLEVVNTSNDKFPGLWLAVLFIPGVGYLATRHWRGRFSSRNKISRDLRLQVLSNLELSNHGEVRPLRILDNIRILVESRASGWTRSAQLDARLENLLAASRQDILPQLNATLDLAEEAGLDRAQVDNARREIAKAGALLDELSSHIDEPEILARFAEDLIEIRTAAERALKGLRQGAATAFETEINKAVRRVMETYADQCAAEDVHCQIDAPDGKSCYARIDEQEFGFILDNLVGNSLRAVHGRQQPRLRVSWQINNGMIDIEVEDNGCGIPASDRELVFEPGFSSRPGGGLGLARSREILLKFGGKLKIARTEVGKGTVMLLRIPACRQFNSPGGAH